jgi:glycosyltransferase involved in cell wall biosynthesis
MSKPVNIRVAHICEQWGKGGIQYLLQDICNASYRRGVIATVDYLYNDQRCGPPTGDGWDVRPIGMNIHTRLDPLGILRMRRMLIRFAPEVLHCHSYYAVLAALALRITGLQIPIVYSVHADVFRSRQRSNLVMDYVFSRADSVVAVSHNTAMTVEKFTGGKVHSEVVCNGIDLLKFDRCQLDKTECRRSLNIDSNTLALVTVARLTTQKDHPTLIRAMAEVVKEAPFMQLLIVSDGVERSNLEALVRKLDMQSHIRFCGEVANIDTYLAAADAFVLSTNNEGFGISVIEAAYSGLPIIATNLGPIAELKRSGIGIALAEPNNVISLRDQILSMRDPEERARLAKNNREVTRSAYSIERVVDQYLAIYSRLVTDERSRQTIYPIRTVAQVEESKIKVRA